MFESNQKSVSSAAQVPSFLIECLVFNVPDKKFNLVQGCCYEDVKAVLAWLWHELQSEEDSEFVEVSGLKWLFSEKQGWTVAKAREFLYQAWHYVGFENS